MANDTAIAIPDNIDDKIVLRRVLDTIVQKLDELAGNRGDNKSASVSQLVTTATSLEGLRKDINSLDLQYVRLDGKSPITAPLRYSKDFKISANQLASSNSIDSKLSLDDYVLKDTTSAPIPLPAAATLSDIILAFNDLILRLKTTKVLS